VAAAMGTGIRRAIDVVGISSRCWILTVVALTLDSTLAAGFGTMDVADAVGTSSRRVIDAIRNTADSMETSSRRRVRLGMICIFSNYRLRIFFLSISCNSS
jgi:hypothetical protein